MARTFKREPYRWYNKESKEARKNTNRKTRKSNKRKLHTFCDPDELLFDPSPRTEGWETH